MNLNGPIAMGDPTLISATVFALDPQLGEIETCHGRLTFIHVVGITLDEWETVVGWQSGKFTELLAKTNPLLVTDLRRQSILVDPETSDIVRRGIETHGSSTGLLYPTTLKWEVVPGRSAVKVTL